MPNLLQLLSNDDGNIRKTALLALAFKGEYSAYKKIIPLLKDKHWQIRVAAVQCLEILKCKEAIPYLFNRLGTDPQKGRKVILDILAARKPQQQEEEDSSQVENSFRVRKAIAHAIAVIDENYLINPLINSLNSDNINMKLAAITGLGNIGAENAVDNLLKLLDNENILIQKAVIVSLGKIKSKLAVEKLIEFTDHNDAQIRMEAIIALNHIKDSRAIKIFIEKLNDPDINVKKTAVIALGNTKNPEILDFLLEKLHDKSIVVRRAVVSSLINYREERVLESIITLLEQETDEDFIKEISLTFNKIFAGIYQ